MNKKQQEVLLDWMRKIHQLEYAHRYESMDLNKWNYRLGIPALLLGAIIGSVGVINAWNGVTKDIFLSTAGIIVALLSGFQTFVKPQELAEKHKTISSNCEQLRHKIELLLNSETNNEDTEAKLEVILREWNNIDAESVSEKFFLQAKEKVKKFQKYPEELGFLESHKPTLKK